MRSRKQGRKQGLEFWKMSFEPETTVKIVTCDMHTAGEPLRIVVSGFPSLEGSSLLEKREFARLHKDSFRQLLMNEPRGHKDMYGALLMKNSENEIEVLFIHNEGYSSMCGHAVLALGQYVIDAGLVPPTSPETEVILNCPCGPVKTYVEYSNNKCGKVRFHSVPAFVYKIGVKILVPSLGQIEVDISYGGAFYVIVKDETISVNLKTSSLNKMIEIAALVTGAVKEQMPPIHPVSKELSFLYGTIITDGKDSYLDGASTNLCVFADRQVDRSPTGSGVTARMALQCQKGTMKLQQEKEFRSIIGTSFRGKIVEEVKFHGYDAVVVEVSGKAYYTGSHTFYLEPDDPLAKGFQLS
ncbi:trans-L-3-hydroxyproline dehydratase-like [Uloborus diversus]|uniref:trans-L-3-hydroxyproline dehydratase-like n=1 Tax=Uloborus diversus TaxID=327109 RepID=UPI00240A1223|nr:trans-L-3-hydroxyproline dehydratase-like [Uloborus diversus]